MNILIIDDSKEEGLCIWMAEKKINNEYRMGNIGYFDNAEITHVKTYKQGTSELIGLLWNVLLLDHDLGGNKTGYDLLLWLDKNREYIPKRIYSITNNPIGENNMLRILDTWKEEGLIDEYA